MTRQEDQYTADVEELSEPEEGGGVIEGGCIAVPDGEYELRYSFYETGLFFGTPKVVVYFAISAPDKYAGTPVCRFYNAKELTGPCGKYGNYKAPPRGDLAREYKQLLKKPGRTDRISFHALKGKCILARLETVTRSYNWKALDPDNEYSCVAELIRIIDEDFGP